MLLNYRKFLMTERFLIGTSILRICIGVILLYNYFIHYKQRYFFGMNQELISIRRSTNL